LPPISVKARERERGGKERISMETGENESQFASPKRLFFTTELMTLFLRRQRQRQLVLLREKKAIGAGGAELSLPGVILRCYGTH